MEAPQGFTLYPTAPTLGGETGAGGVGGGMVASASLPDFRLLEQVREADQRTGNRAHLPRLQVGSHPLYATLPPAPTLYAPLILRSNLCLVANLPTNTHTQLERRSF